MILKCDHCGNDGSFDREQIIKTIVDTEGKPLYKNNLTEERFFCVYCKEEVIPEGL